MQKFKKGVLPVNFKPYFTSINKIHNNSTRFSVKNYYFPRINSLYGLNPCLILDVKYESKFLKA